MPEWAKQPSPVLSHVSTIMDPPVIIVEEIQLNEVDDVAMQAYSTNDLEDFKQE